MFQPRLGLLLLLASAALCPACAGRPDGAQVGVPPAHPAFPARSQPGLLALPAPAELAAALGPADRQASYSSDDLRREAEDFEAALPNQRVTASSSGAIFQPDWPKTVPSPFSGLAFAIYHLRAAGYSGDPSLNLSWITAPGIPGNLYYGLANWGANRWDWWQGEPGDKLDLGSTAPYFDSFGGDMLIVVVKIGTGACELDALRLGSLPPMRSLSASPEWGLIPLSVDFDASASLDLDGSIAEYRWDPDGDGVFDQSSGSDPHFTHVYDTVGDYVAGLRLIDNDGIFADITVLIKAFDTTTFSFGTAGYREYPGAILPDTDGNLILLGNREQMVPNSDRDVFFASLSPAQAALVYRSWGGFGDDVVKAARMGADGFIYAVGYTRSSGSGLADALVQKWSPAGDLLWSKAISSIEDDESLFDVIVYGGGIYACGSYTLASINRGLAFIVKLDMDGNLVWKHTVIGPSHSSFGALALKVPMALDPPTVEACGYYGNSSTDTDALYAAYDLDGNMLQCKLWGNASEGQYADGICVTGIANPITTVAGRDFVSRYISFVSHPGGAVYLLSSPDGLETSAVSLNPGGSGALSLLLEGQDSSNNSGYFILARLAGDLSLGSWYAQSSLGQDYCIPTALSFYSGAHLAVAGYQDGPVPAPLPFNLEQSASLEAWEDITPSQGNPSQLSVSDTGLATADIPDGVFNREGQNDFDALIHITPSG